MSNWCSLKERERKRGERESDEVRPQHTEVVSLNLVRSGGEETQQDESIPLSVSLFSHFGSLILSLPPFSFPCSQALWGHSKCPSAKTNIRHCPLLLEGGHLAQALFLNMTQWETFPSDSTGDWCVPPYLPPFPPWGFPPFLPCFCSVLSDKLSWMSSQECACLLVFFFSTCHTCSERYFHHDHLLVLVAAL